MWRKHHGYSCGETDYFIHLAGFDCKVFSPIQSHRSLQQLLLTDTFHSWWIISSRADKTQPTLSVMYINTAVTLHESYPNASRITRKLSNITQSTCTDLTRMSILQTRLERSCSGSWPKACWPDVTDLAVVRWADAIRVTPLTPASLQHTHTAQTRVCRYSRQTVESQHIEKA